MTTPAVNHLFIDAPRGTAKRVSGGTTTYYTGRTTLEYAEARRRPASTTSTWETRPDGLRWRKPTAWSHNSFSLIARGGVVSATNTRAPGNTQWTAPNETGRVATRAFKDGTISLDKLRITPELNSLVSKAETKALDDLREGDVQLGETFAQWRQTTRLVTRHVGTIRGQWVAFKRKHPKAAKNIQKNCRGCSASQLWLELVYGWVPLLQDIYGSIAILSDLADKSGLVVRCRGSARDVTSEKCPGGRLFSSPSGPGFNVHADEFEIVTSHRVGVQLWYQLKNQRIATFSALGLINPVELSWNLVPYSFLVDWFLPIGPWLGSFTADAGFEFVSGTKSYKRTIEETKVIPLTVTPTQNTLVNVVDPPATFTLNAEYFRRTVYLSRPVPGLYFKNPLSPMHVLNALALLRQAFR